MKVLAFTLGLTLLGLGAAEAGQRIHAIHIERLRGTTLTIEHTPTPAVVARRVTRKTVRRASRKRVQVARSVRRTRIVRRYSSGSAIAGGCWDAGYVRRVVDGRAVTLQRERCAGIAPLSSLPGAREPAERRF